MGVGSDFSCCSCNNVKRSIFFDIDDDNKKKNSNNNNDNNKVDIKGSNKIEVNNVIQNKNKNLTANFNKNGSQIVNATSITQGEFILEAQAQQDDSFENMYEKLNKE